MSARIKTEEVKYLIRSKTDKEKYLIRLKAEEVKCLIGSKTDAEKKLMNEKIRYLTERETETKDRYGKAESHADSSL